jgi:GNAT superfamily N-acetyltransferase
MTEELRVATVDDVGPMAAVLADAFHDDPIFTWLFPDPSERPRLSQAMFAMLGEHIYVGHGESLIGADVAGYWEPPGVPADDDFWIEHGEAFASALEGQVERVAALGEAMATHHPPAECWYLPLLGVRPSAQGRGLGGRLLARKLEHIDRSGDAAYLEASSPRNRVLYERHGFELVSEFSAEGGPPMWAMWRPPR